MAGRKGYWKRAFVPVIVLLLLTGYLMVINGGAVKTAQETPREKAIDNIISAIHAHPLTPQEAVKLEATIGVRQPGYDYNKIIDGHGTGYAPPSKKEWDMMIGKVMVVDGVSLPRATKASLDLSQDPWFPPIGNQGAQGSCAAWAMTYYAYTYEEAKDNNWAADTGNPAYIMSPAWTYNKVNGGTDSGSFMAWNGLVITNWGAATLATMPYNPSNPTYWGSEAAMREAPLHRAAEVYMIPYNASNPTWIINVIKSLLAQGIPVTFAMDADLFTSAFSDGNYIISSAEYPAYSIPNHGQTIVGYDDSISDDGDVGAFRVANSWGTNWGDNGFYWMTYKAFENASLGNYSAVTFIVDRPSYDPQLLGIIHFNSPPERDVNITFGIGNPASPLKIKPLYYKVNDNDANASNLTMPTFIAYDLTDFASEYANGTIRFFVKISASGIYNGVLSSFRVENYSTGYVPKAPTQISPQSPDVPATTPCTANVYFAKYPAVSKSVALDNQNLTFININTTDAYWVSVDRTYYVANGTNNYSMQSGDIADRGKSGMGVIVTGPGKLTFYWSISSEAGHDFLYVYLDSTEKGNISGTVNWTRHTVWVGLGTHTVKWIYEKDNTNSVGTDAAWVDYVVWTPTNDTVPSPPQNVSAVAGDGYINVTWDPPADNGGANITAYNIYRGTASGSEQLIATVDRNTTYYNDTAVTKGIRYYYYITAENYVGESNASAEVSAVCLGPPSAPQNLVANGGVGFVNLTWDAPLNDGGTAITEYRIYRGNSSGNETLYATVDGNTLYYNDTNVSKGVDYYYYVTAVNSVGESNASNEASTVVLGVPDAPENLTAQAGVYYVYLHWNAPANTGGTSITEYRIYRGTAAGNETLLATVTGSINYYNDTSVDGGITYYYYVTAVNSVGESVASAEISALPIGKPGAPVNVTVKAGDGYVELNWLPPANDGGTAITEYRIYRGTSPGNETLIATVNGTVTTYKDKSVKNGVTYYYYITAVNKVGESSASEEVKATPKSSFPINFGSGATLPILLIILAIIVLVIIVAVLKRKKGNKGVAESQPEEEHQETESEEQQTGEETPSTETQEEEEI